MTFLFRHFRPLAKQHLLSKGMPMPQQLPEEVEEVPSRREKNANVFGTWDWKVEVRPPCRF